MTARVVGDREAIIALDAVEEPGQPEAEAVDRSPLEVRRAVVRTIELIEGMFRAESG